MRVFSFVSGVKGFAHGLLVRNGGMDPHSGLYIPTLIQTLGFKDVNYLAVIASRQHVITFTITFVLRHISGLRTTPSTICGTKDSQLVVYMLLLLWLVSCRILLQYVFTEEASSLVQPLLIYIYMCVYIYRYMKLKLMGQLHSLPHP